MPDGGTGQPRSRRWQVVLGVLAVVIGLSCGSGVVAGLSTTLYTPDETAHVDYAYQLWHGRLPVFDEGITFTPGEGVRIPPVQWEAHHPPLYYLLIAPVVGPLIDSDRWQAAVMGARLVSIGLAVGCVLALAWAGSLLTVRRRWAWAIAVPAVVAPIAPFMRVGGAAYNDNLPATITVLSLGVAISMLRYGPTRWRLVLIAVLSALGSLARANFVVTMIVLTAAVAVAVWLHGRGGWPRRLGLSALAGMIPFAAGLAASGWFYARNARLTGSWTGGQSDYGVEVMERHLRTPIAVLTDPYFWTQQLQLLRQPTFDSADWLGPWVLAGFGSVGLVACSVWAVRFLRHPPFSDDDETAPIGVRPGARVVQTLIVLALTAQLVGSLLVQVAYATIGGATITRYLLPALLPIGALLAAAVLCVGRRLAGAGLLLYLGLAWGLFVQWMWLVSTKDGVQLSGETGNHVPWLAIWAAMALLVAAVVVQALALTDWRRAPSGPQGADAPAASLP